MATGKQSIREGTLGGRIATAIEARALQRPPGKPLSQEALNEIAAFAETNPPEPTKPPEV
jgi:hypothetical protein